MQHIQLGYPLTPCRRARVEESEYYPKDTGLRMNSFAHKVGTIT
jgi:hypothetical protein